MFCGNCGKKSEDTWAFCNFCGKARSVLPTHTIVCQNESLVTYDVAKLVATFDAALKLLEPADRMMNSLMETEQEIAHCRRLNIFSKLVIGFVVVFIGGLNALFGLLFGDSELAFYAIIYVVGGLILVWLLQMPRRIRRKRLQSKRDTLRWRISDYWENTLNKSHLKKIIPRDFRHSAALSAMNRYLRNMEATNWQECVALWKAEEMAYQTKQHERRQAIDNATCNTCKHRGWFWHPETFTYSCSKQFGMVALWYKACDKYEQR